MTYCCALNSGVAKAAAVGHLMTATISNYCFSDSLRFQLSLLLHLLPACKRHSNELLPNIILNSYDMHDKYYTM